MFRQISKAKDENRRYFPPSPRQVNVLRERKLKELSRKSVVSEHVTASNNTINNTVRLSMFPDYRN